ncbi:unnamed protein product [Mytilus edulis]|uniref:Uncharacterized protein n=1 Tax=Mytilus edulis TaxID=6550 RepID=A0A8S3R3H8_MYTED|nr:unnamed protein product [Mytilus edulis]
MSLFTGDLNATVLKKVLSKWYEKGEVEEVSTGECSRQCPGENNDRCGDTDCDNVVSAYKFKGDNTEDIHLGSTCFYTDPYRNERSTPIRGNCCQRLQFKCQTVDASDGSRQVSIKRCYQLHLNWYQAEEKCRKDKTYLPSYTPSNDKCISQTENKPIFNYKCLAIELRKDRNYTMLAVNCKDKHKALCVRKPKTETTIYTIAKQETTDQGILLKTTTGLVTVSSNRLPRAVDMQNPSSNNSKVELYIAVPLTVAVLLVSVIVTMICIKRRRKRKTNENENEQNMSAVYYSTVPDEVTLKKDSDLPLADDNGACLVNETDVYNHLGDTDQQNHSDVTGPVYDHTGLQDNDQYDISVISEKRTNKDGDDFNHYDLMQVSADINSVYDETSTARKTNGDKSIDSVDIYDHAKQTENDYDTTDTQKQHEQCEHVHEPTYDQSGSCENLREPTYDQSGPSKNLTDPMYDHSAKQSSTNQQ